MHEWSEADEEPVLIGKIIAAWIAQSSLERDADAFVRRVKARLLLKEILGAGTYEWEGEEVYRGR